MEWIEEPERKIPVLSNVELLVCGGGVAGGAAAVCAARNGVGVLLIEKNGFLGGLVTSALVITTPPLDNGINLEISKRMKEKAAYSPCLNSGEEIEWLNMHAIDPEIFKIEYTKMLQEAGVDILLHTYIVGTIMDGHIIKGAIIENKAGRQAILFKMVIDATGDEDIAAFSGAPFKKVKKPMTLMFNMVGVNVPVVIQNIGNWGNLKKVVREGINKGELLFELGTQMDFGAPGVHAEKLVYDDEINVWSGNLLNMDGLNPKEVTTAELVTREHAVRLASFLKKRIPGFEKSRIEYTAPHVGIRATRQIIGRSSPSMKDVMANKFKDTAVKPYVGADLRLPYGSLLPQNVDNLLVAGRCISAQEEAMGQLRLIPVCSATGQTAGTAAALALKQNISPCQLEAPLLQKILGNQGVNLGLD